MIQLLQAPGANTLRKKLTLFIPHCQHSASSGHTNDALGGWCWQESSFAKPYGIRKADKMLLCPARSPRLELFLLQARTLEAAEQSYIDKNQLPLKTMHLADVLAAQHNEQNVYY